MNDKSFSQKNNFSSSAATFHNELPEAFKEVVTDIYRRIRESEDFSKKEQSLKAKSFSKYKIKTNHTKIWQSAVDDLTIISIIIAFIKWPGIVNELKNEASPEMSPALTSKEQNNLLKEFPKTISVDEIYEILSTQSEIFRILSIIDCPTEFFYLNSLRTVKYFKKYVNNEKKEFWFYFITVLRNNIFDFHTNYSINKIRAYPLPVRTQRKLNKIFNFFHKKKNIQDLAKFIYTDEAKQMILEEGIIESAEELEKILKANLLSLKGKATTSSMRAAAENNSDDSSQDQTPETEITGDSSQTEIQNSIVAEEIKEYLSLMDFAYIKKLKVKKQNETDQLKKKQFLKKMLTIYAVQKCPYKTDEKEFRAFIKNKQFADQEILNRMIPLDNNIKPEKISINSLCIEEGKPRNYGAKRLKDFKDFYLKINGVPLP